MKYLGEGILFEKIEALPNEEVLWEGKADKRGFLSGMFMIFAVIFIIIAGLMFIFNIDTIFFNTVPNPEYMKEDSKNRDISNAGEVQQKIIKKKKIRKTLRVVNKTNVTIFLILLGGYILMTMYFIYIGYKNSFYLITTERVIIQRGYKSKVLTAIDLDKIITVRSSQSWFQKILKIHSIHITNAGIEIVQNGFFKSGINVIGNIPISENITSKLLNEWLPRDNRKLS